MKAIVSQKSKAQSTASKVEAAIKNPTAVQFSDKPLTHDEYSTVAVFGW